MALHNLRVIQGVNLFSSLKVATCSNLVHTHYLVTLREFWDCGGVETYEKPSNSTEVQFNQFILLQSDCTCKYVVACLVQFTVDLS